MREDHPLPDDDEAASMSETTEGIEYDGSNADEVAEYVGWLSKGLVRGSSSLLVLTEDSSIDMQVGDRIVRDGDGLRLVDGR